jgi:hypothetical protein
MKVIALLSGLLFFIAAHWADPEKREQMESRSCQRSELAIAPGPDISPPTGQRPLTLRVINRGRSRCRLYGYPTIELRDRAGRIPFLIRNGGDQVVTSRRPTRVFVAVGRAAFVVLNKYRCDLGEVRTARVLRLGLRRVSDRSSTSLPLRHRREISYCGKGDPGSIVSVSPFAPTLERALRR